MGVKELEIIYIYTPILLQTSTANDGKHSNISKQTTTVQLIIIHVGAKNIQIYGQTNPDTNIMNLIQNFSVSFSN